MTNEQLAVLRSLAASAATKPTPKFLLSRQLASDGVSAAYTSNSLLANSSGGYRPSSAASTSLQQQHLPPHHAQKNRGQDPFAASTPPSKTKSADPATCAAQQRAASGIKTVGGFKSSTVQLEVELVERLNEIERSKVWKLWLLGLLSTPCADLAFFDSSTRKRRVDSGRVRERSMLLSIETRCVELNSTYVATYCILETDFGSFFS